VTVNGAQYLLPDGLRLGAAREALAAQIGLLEDGTRSRVERVFYDTFDGRLHAAGLALVQADGRLSLMGIDAYGERASAPFEQASERIFASDLPAGRLRDQLAPLLDVRALVPIARTRSQMLGLRMLNGDDKTIARLIVESCTAQGPGRGLTKLRSRVHVLPVRGYEGAAERLKEQLESQVGLVRAPSPLHDEAVTIAGGTPGGLPATVDLPLRPTQRADAAAVQVLQRLLSTIEVNLPGTLADVDTEFLHDLRVAVRRTRSLQRELRTVFPPEPLARFREGFRWLQAITGPTRDLDVYLLDFDRFREILPGATGADLDALEQVLIDERKNAQRRMARALRSEKALMLLADWSAFIDELVQLPVEDRPDARVPVGELASDRIHKVYRQMLKRGRAVENGSPAEALHDLRKQGKELRYLLEFFAVLYPDDVVRPMVKRLKSLQDVLGRFQDSEVQAGMLLAHREAVGARENGAAALMAMGLLVDRLEREQLAARAEFGKCFASFAASRQRELVEATFG
jgi:CHAD domain-containing protein